MTAWELLELVRDLFSRYPEFCHHAAWELQWLLFALGYTNVLESEHEIDLARVLVLTDRTGREAA
jgi:hypothetical protein